MRRASRRPSLLSRAYAWLSRLYPASFRDDYQRELDAAFRHQIDEAGSRRTQVAVGALADVLRTAPGVRIDQHQAAPSRRGASSRSSDVCVRRSGHFGLSTCGDRAPAS